MQKKYITILILASATGFWIMQNPQPTQKPPASTVEVAGAAVVAPYGAWTSPLTAASIFESADDFSYLTTAEDRLYFTELRASENGRSVLVRLEDDQSTTVLSPAGVSVRTRVHEYGGMPYLINGDDVYYSDFDDQKIYRLRGGLAPEALTPAGLRYMECLADNKYARLICVREDHRAEGEAVNTLVAVGMENGGEGDVLFEGTDFVTNPTLSPDGSELAFITWSHPNMDWDDTQLRIISLDDTGGVASIREINQSGNVSINNPKYGADGTLYFMADFDNWWTLYKSDANDNPVEIISDDIEMGGYVFESDTSAVITYASGGLHYLARADLITAAVTTIGEAFASAGSLNATAHGIYFAASTPTSTTAIYQLTGNDYVEVYRPNGPNVEGDYLSTPIAITYPTGNNNSQEAYGFYYPPKNADFKGPAGELPPLIVKVHGGPVGATRASLSPGIQFWTSRGFGVFDVNHRGSTGYGRAYRKLLYPNWGIVDIEDAANGANWLVDQGYVDGDKLAISGGSAGGYTVLAAFAFQDIFKAGASYYGISDLEILARDTHKYESHFLDQLIGPYPEARDIYLERSPIYSVDNIKAPLLLLQGLDDKVVPPNQSEMIFNALKAHCVPTAYLTFEGEGHVFRQPANNIRSLNAELDFYGQIFGFTPAGNIEPVELITCE